MFYFFIFHDISKFHIVIRNLIPKFSTFLKEKKKMFPTYMYMYLPMSNTHGSGFLRWSDVALCIHYSFTIIMGGSIPKVMDLRNNDLVDELIELILILLFSDKLFTWIHILGYPLLKLIIKFVDCCHGYTYIYM